VAVQGLDLPKLQAYVDEHVPGTGPLTAELLHGGRSNLTYRLTDGTQTWVLRRPPLGGLTPSAHDMKREYTVVAALYGHGVPVARPIVQCEDDSVIGAPFAVVEFVDGRVIRTGDELAALTDGEVHDCAFALIDALAALHAVDPASVGLERFGKPQGYLGRQVRRWYDQWTRVQTRPLPDVETLHERLAAITPEESGASIVHGDFRIDNAILGPMDVTEVRALVDWEMSTLGDPLSDLGLHIAYSDPAFDPVLAGGAAATSTRMPRAEELVGRYAKTSGRDVGDWPFYLALGYFKAAVIAEGIHARFVAGKTLGEGFETVGGAVEPLAAAGLRALGS
jgi:aminoglycoside phosphotransferase (APT) family kinase protein